MWGTGSGLSFLQLAGFLSGFLVSVNIMHVCLTVSAVAVLYSETMQVQCIMPFTHMPAFKTPATHLRLR